MGNVSPKPVTPDASKSIIYETAQTLKRLSASSRKTPPAQGQTQGTDSIEQQQQSPPTPLLRTTTQELLRKKPSFEQPQLDRSTSSSRRLSIAMNDDINILPKAMTPQPYDRTPPMYSRSLTRSNSINRANKDQEKFSSGERSYHTSGAQSRRVSIGLNRSPVRADELELVLTKVNSLLVVLYLLLLLLRRRRLLKKNIFFLIFNNYIFKLIFFSLLMKKLKH